MSSHPTIPTDAVAPRLFFNPKDPSFNDDPYPHYKRLRDEDPVHRSVIGVWFVGRYEDVRNILRDRRFTVQDVPGQLRRKSSMLQSRQFTEGQPKNLDALVANSENWFAFLEPPNHTRLRQLVTNAFQRHTAEKMRSYIRQSAQELIERVRPQGRMDLMRDFASLLPQKVIATVLGIPPADFPRCVEWVEVISRIFDPFVSLEELDRLNDSSMSFMDYLRTLVQERRQRPQSDLITALIEARDNHDKLSERELISVIILIFGAGEETVVNMIGNSTLALMRNPDKRAYLIQRPEILGAAVEELLRYDAPLQMTSRTASEAVEIGGKLIQKGDQVYVALGSANRDPERFDNPDEIIFERPNNVHMSFAYGHHLCVGAPMARIEAQEAFRVLLEMVPDLEVATDHIQWRQHIVLRGMRSLPVKFTASSRSH